MPVDDLEEIEQALRKRGFRRDDVFLHECPSCQTRAVATYIIAGRGGGRDIGLCLECGVARSWRTGSGMEGRVEDPNFDLRAFLR